MCEKKRKKPELFVRIPLVEFFLFYLCSEFVFVLYKNEEIIKLCKFLFKMLFIALIFTTAEPKKSLKLMKMLDIKRSLS